MPLLQADATKLIRTRSEIERLFPWLKSDLIRGIPHFITPAWAEDKSRFDPEAYAEAWAKIGFESVTLLTVHHDGHYLYPSAHTSARPGRDFFGEQVAACRKRGIRVIAYYSLSLNSLVGSEHPEWRVRDAHDRVLVPDHKYFFHYHWLCVNSPFREFVRAQFRELAERYDIDGYYLDILYLPPHPPACDLVQGQETCFCAHCHRAYSTWYGGEHLIDSLRTKRHDEFRAESYRRFLIDLKTDLLGAKRSLFLTFNGAGKRRMPFYDRVDELADYDTGEAHTPDTRCLYSKLLAEDDRLFELISCAELRWSHNVPKPTPLIRLESLATIIGGGTYTIGINHAPDGRLQNANIDRLAEWSSWLRGHRDLLRGGEPITEIGLLEAGQCCLANQPAIWRWIEFLRNGHFLFTVIRNFDPERAPRAMIIPAGLALDDDLVIGLEAYVRRGGRLLVEAPLPRRNGDGPLLLESLVGAAHHGTAKGYAFYLQPVNASLAEGLLADEPVYFQCGQASLLQCKTARCIADLVPQFEDKQRLTDLQSSPNCPARKEQADWHPGVIVNTFGKGTVMTVALQLSCEDKDARRHPWPQQLVKNLLNDLLGGQAIRIHGHKAIEVIAQRRGNEVTLHFLNHLYDAGDFITGERECIQFADITVELSELFSDAQSAAALTPELSEVTLIANNGAPKFHLPRLGLYGAVQLKMAGQTTPAASQVGVKS